MAGQLKFEISEIARIIAAARSATTFRVSYEEQFDDDMHLGGKVKMLSEFEVDLSNIDPAKMRPKLWLVKDSGVYLMSNGVVAKDEKIAVTYAKNLSPKDEDSYEYAREIMGGDDCVIALPVEDFEELLNTGALEIFIDVTEESLEIGGIFRKKEAKQKAPNTSGTKKSKAP